MKTSNPPTCALTALFLGLGALVQNGLATNLTWNGGGTDNNWGTAGNWGGVPLTSAATNNLIFSGSTRLTNTNNLAGQTNGWVQFTSGGFALAGNPLVLNPAGNAVLTNLAGINTLAMNLNLAAAGKWWFVAPGSEVRLAGGVTNPAPSGTATGWLFLTNGGTVRITGNAQSTRGMDLYQGTVVVDGGYVDQFNDGVRFRVPAAGQTATTILTNNGLWRIGEGGNFRLANNSSITKAGSLSQMFLASGTLELYYTNANTAGGTIFVGETAGAKAVFNQNGGVVRGTGNSGTGVLLVVGNAADADGTYNLNGGLLWAGKIQQANGPSNAVFNFNGGTLKPWTNSATFMQGLLTANILGGGALIDTTNFNVTIGQNLQGPGSLTKLGSGTLTLTGYDTYTGDTLVSNGTLAAATSVIVGGGGVIVADGATLNAVYNGSTWSAASLTAGSTGASTLKIDLSAGNPGSAPILVNNLVGRGSVAINLTGTSLLAGQFPLIQFTTATGLANFHLGSVPPGVSATLVPTANALELNISSVVNSLVWSGAADAQWNTAAFNWSDLNNGSNPTNYAQAAGFGDMVTFDDSASGSTSIEVGLTVTPVAIAVNNNSYPYRFAGSGKLGGGGSLTKDGSQSLTLATGNDYSGGTVLNAGIIYLGADQALGTGEVALNLGTIASDGAAARSLPNSLTFNGNIGIILGDPGNPGPLTLGGSLDFGGGLARVLNFNSDIVSTGAITNGGLATKTGPGRWIIKGQGTQAGLVSQQQGDVIIDGGRLDSTDGWRLQNFFSGTTLRFAVTNGGVFTLNSATGNFRVGLSGGDNSSDNILDIAGVVSLYAPTTYGRLDLGQSGANAIVNLRPGGWLRCRAITATTPANNVLNLDGGTLQPIADEPAFMQGLNAANVLAGGVIVDTTNFNITISQALLAAGAGGLTKNGPGTLALLGADTYSGATRVNAGKLLLGAAHAAPGTITVATNATLGFVSSTSGETVSVAAVNCTDGAAVEAQFLGLSTNPPVPAGFIASLTLNGLTKVNLAAAGVTTGQFPLFGYGSITGSGRLAVGQVPQGLAATLITNTSAKTIDLVISGALPLVWTGLTDANWDLTTTNWSLSSSPARYTPGDNVQFDDSANSTAVNLATVLTPGGLLVSNVSKDYVLAGAGGLGGGLSLTKNGAGKLTLATANSFIGTVTVKAGTVVAGNGTALGTTNGATAIQAGATLDVNTVNLGLEPVLLAGAGVGGAGALINSGSDQNDALRNVTLTGNTTVGGSALIGLRTIADSDPGLVANGFKLTKVGANQFNINGGTTVAGLVNVWATDIGDIDIQQGTLSFQRRAALGNSTNTITLFPGARLLLFALNQTIPVPDNHLRLTNAALEGTSFTIGDINTLAGPIALAGPSNTIQATAGSVLALNGPIQGSGGVQYAGSVILAGTNTYTGQTVVTNGTLILTDTARLTGTTNLTVNSPATLDVSAAGGWPLGTSQTLSGDGTVNGAVLANGTVAPGNPLGTLTFNHDLTLAGTTLLTLRKDGGLTNAAITVNGTLAYGGTLRVVVAGTTALAVNDTFKLFHFATPPAGGFTLNLPAGYTWDTSALAVDGTLKVTGVISPTPPVIGTVTVAGGNLTLTGSGGAAGGTYYVVSTTNVVTPLANWLSGKTNTFATDGKFTNTLPVLPVEPQRFYRLRTP